MKNIEVILREFGIELPDDKKEAINKEIAENYKTIAEFTKQKDRLTDAETRLKEANDKIAGFGDVDVDAIKKEVADWKQKAESAEKEFAAKIAQRDFDDALTKAIDGIKFSSNAAKDSIVAKIKAANLPYKDGKIFGLADLVDSFKKDDATAFAPDNAPAAKFTDKGTGVNNGGTTLTKDDIFKEKDAIKRQKLIMENPSLFQ